MSVLENNKALAVTQSCLVSMGFEVVKGDGVATDFIINNIGVKLVKVEATVRPTAARPADLKPDEAFCPCCGVRSTDVATAFGFRMRGGKQVRQSHCRSCRSAFPSRKMVAKNAARTVVMVDLDAIASNDLNVMYREVLKIAKAIKVKPPERRVRHAAKRADSDDYEAIVMRLTQFQRTFNPPASVMAKYEPILAAESARAARRYSKLLIRIGEDADDLNNIARVYFVSYWFQHAQKDGNEMNERMLVYNIRQQFSRWYQVTWAKLKNVDFSGTGLPIDEYTSSPMPNSQLHSAAEEDASIKDEHRTINAAYTCSMEDLIDKARQVRSAGSREEALDVLESKPRFSGFSGQALEAGLQSMPHDLLVSRLTDIINSDFIDFDARRLAKRKLQAHQEGCDACGHGTHQSLVK